MLSIILLVIYYQYIINACLQLQLHDQVEKLTGKLDRMQSRYNEVMRAKSVLSTQLTKKDEEKNKVLNFISIQLLSDYLSIRVLNIEFLHSPLL